MNDVTQWIAEVEHALDGTDIEGLDLATVLSLIHVESAGDPAARRPGSQFCGLLQMGRAAGLDVGFEDDGTDTTDGLLDNPTAAIAAFVLYVERYKGRLLKGPNASRSIAALWKGGPGTAAYIKHTWARQSMSFKETIKEAAEAKAVPGLSEYVRRFDRAHDIYGD